ncbi:unnamed protein product [Blepharisma stoltei]|uniref:Enkurin domain-containing protein n=1 Tax=Blepharisma stoltei TaxID=1481888 RepID=A0AAU9I786_9CILI|nr:unnamed protein product [Blepharisma stoltei]
MNEYLIQKNSLPVLTSKRIREIIEKPTKISYSTRLTQNLVSQSLSSPLSPQASKSFLPFISERDSSGKILPSKSETSLPSIVNIIKGSKSEINIDQSSPKSGKKPLESIEELGNPEKNRKKYQKVYRLTSPKRVQLPAVGFYNIQSSFDKKDIGFYSPKAEKCLEIIRDASPVPKNDVTPNNEFQEKQSPLPDIKKVHGRLKKFASRKHAVNDTSIKNHNKYSLIHPTLADVDINGYMHEISDLEKNIQEQLNDLKKSHKKLTMLY